MTDSMPTPDETDEPFEWLTDERLAEIAELADEQDDELAFGTLEVIRENLALRDLLDDTQRVLTQFGYAIDTMCLVAEQANDKQAKRLIDAAFQRAGLLEPDQSAFPARDGGQ